MDFNSRPRTAFASSGPNVLGSGDVPAPAHNESPGIDFIPNLQHPFPVQSSTTAPSYDLPQAYTPYTPPPLPPSRSALLSPIDISFNHNTNPSRTSSFMIDLNDDLNQPMSSPTPTPSPTRRAYVETVIHNSPRHDIPPSPAQFNHNPPLWNSPRHAAPYEALSRSYGGVSPGQHISPVSQDYAQRGSPVPQVFTVPRTPPHSGGVHTPTHLGSPSRYHPSISREHTGLPFSTGPPSLHHRTSFEGYPDTSVHPHSQHASLHTPALTPHSSHEALSVDTVPPAVEYCLPEPTQAAITIAQGTMKDIEVLKNAENFVTWESQVLNIITSLSLTGHICNNPSTTEPRMIYNSPVIPPTNPNSPTFLSWRRNDQIVSGFILQRLAPEVRRGVLPALTQGRPTTAREHWEHIQRRWGLANDVQVKATLRRLFATKAQSINDLDVYVTKYRNNVNLISGSRRGLDWSDILQNLADGLPRHLPLISPIYLAISRHADLGPDLCDRSHFESATLELQNLWVRESSTYEKKQ
ncbi:hypothetical protein VKT23_008595 [Stygiomarasmius scandens]|uniref:Retrotransposon Copia-like N-terminal domain-containing protein n=1 Tax=Marasmiellus scandens TaxID=2682957 RepID=A0ABR1JHI0_9AGAR